MGFSLQSLIFEVVNFLVLLWVLQRLVYRPLRRSLDARRAAMREIEVRAEERRAEAESVRASFEQRASEIDGLREDALRVAGEEAAAQRARLLEQARDDAAADEARARRMLEAEREEALRWVRELTIERATELAGQLLLQIAPKAVDEALFDTALAEVERRASGLRAEVSPTESSVRVELTCARVPSETELEHLRTRLQSALSVTPRLAIEEDESLGAGVIVRIGDTSIDTTLAGQLAGLRDRARETLERREGADAR